MIVLCILGAAGYVAFNVFKKDESKVAEVVMQKEDKMMDDKMTDDKMQKDTMEKTAAQKVSGGSFIKIDALHYAGGDVSVEKSGENYKISFAENFASANGPDLYVYLSAPQAFKNTALGGFDTAKTINLGLLKSQKGKQEYLVSAKDFEANNGAVIIWCKQFSVQFSRADLK